MFNRLYLYHGRQDPGQDMDDWGDDGPELHNVVSLLSTYGNFRVLFASHADTEIARAITGWEYWDENQLEVPIIEDLVYVPATQTYYGDWELGFPPDFLLNFNGWYETLTNSMLTRYGIEPPDRADARRQFDAGASIKEYLDWVEHENNLTPTHTWAPDLSNPLQALIETHPDAQLVAKVKRYVCYD